MLRSNEVEIKYRIQDPREIARFIEEKWGVRGRKKRIYDVYFDTPTLDLIRNSIAFRTRVIGLEGEKKTYLITYKRKIKTSDHIMHREEIEKEIDPDIYESLHLADYIEFDFEGQKGKISPVIGIESHRLEYDLGNVKIVIDEVKFSDELMEFFLEIEGPEEEIKKIRSELEREFHLEPLALSKLELGLKYMGLQ